MCESRLLQRVDSLAEARGAHAVNGQRAFYRKKKKKKKIRR